MMMMNEGSRTQTNLTSTMGNNTPMLKVLRYL